MTSQLESVTTIGGNRAGNSPVCLPGRDGFLEGLTIDDGASTREDLEAGLMADGADPCG